MDEDSTSIVGDIQDSLQELMQFVTSNKEYLQYFNKQFVNKDSKPVENFIKVTQIIEKIVHQSSKLKKLTQIELIESPLTTQDRYNETVATLKERVQRQRATLQILENSRREIKFFPTRS